MPTRNRVQIEMRNVELNPGLMMAQTRVGRGVMRKPDPAAWDQGIEIMLHRLVKMQAVYVGKSTEPSGLPRASSKDIRNNLENDSYCR